MDEYPVGGKSGQIGPDADFGSMVVIGLGYHVATTPGRRPAQVVASGDEWNTPCVPERYRLRHHRSDASGTSIIAGALGEKTRPSFRVWKVGRFAWFRVGIVAQLLRWVKWR